MERVALQDLPARHNVAPERYFERLKAHLMVYGSPEVPQTAAEAPSKENDVEGRRTTAPQLHPAGDALFSPDQLAGARGVV